MAIDERPRFNTEKSAIIWAKKRGVFNDKLKITKEGSRMSGYSYLVEGYVKI